MKEVYKKTTSKNNIRTHKTSFLKTVDDIKNYQLIDVLLGESSSESDKHSVFKRVSKDKKIVLTLLEILPTEESSKKDSDIATSILAKILLEYGLKSVSRTFSVLGYKIICTSSNSHTDVSTLSTAYHEAVELLLNKKKTMPSGMHYYMDNKTPFKSGYYYPLNKEQNIINHLKSGDFERLSKELDSIFSVNFDDNTLMPLETVKCFFLNLVGTVLKTYEMDNNSIIRLIFNCADIETMINAVKDFYRTCCDEIKVCNIDSTDTFCTDVVNYISARISDTSLNVSSVATYFNVHQNHLSKHFKKETGMNLHTYINSLRVDEAKKLLSQTDASLEGICEQIGFGSYRTFMRVFNQITSMSPSEYKNLIAPKRTFD